LKARLYVLQHGHAVSKEENPDRPLSSQRRHEITRLAEHMAKKDVLIWKIFHSGKLRAEQTAQIISEIASPDVTPEALDGVGPNDDPREFINSLDLSHGSILFAGHMPYVSRLCSILLSGDTGSNFEFQPGTIACLGCVDGKWSLVCMLRPEVI